MNHDYLPTIKQGETKYTKKLSMDVVAYANSLPSRSVACSYKMFTSDVVGDDSHTFLRILYRDYLILIMNI